MLPAFSVSFSWGVLTGFGIASEFGTMTTTALYRAGAPYPTDRSRRRIVRLPLKYERVMRRMRLNAPGRTASPLIKDDRNFTLHLEHSSGPR